MTNDRIWPKLILILITPIILLSLLFVAAGYAADPEEDFETLINLSRTARLDRSSGQPVMLAEGDTIAALWSEGVSADQNQYHFNTGGSGHVWLQSATETGGYWRPRVTVHEADVETLQELAVDSDFVFGALPADTMHIVWAEGRYEDNNILYPHIKYIQCEVSNDFNTCWANSVNIATNNSVKYRSPTIAQDEQGNLHVVWADIVNKELYYSRSYTHTAAITWTTPSKIAAADSDNAQNPQLIFAGGRLHLVWDDEGSDAIKYIYDDDYSDIGFTRSGGKSWDASDNPQSSLFKDYENGNPGNPKLTAMPKLDLLFLTFDIQGSGEEGKNSADKFGLIYARSENNGAGWPTGNKFVLDIPQQNLETAEDFSIYHSNTGANTKGLKPTLALTYTAPITWGSVWLHAAWHDNVSEGEGKTFQVLYSHRVVSTTLDEVWFTPTNVTDPPPPPEPRAKASAGGRQIEGASRDSAAPALAVTNPEEGGLGHAHAAFIEREKGVNTRWDVYYRGVIISTIDPDYLRDESVFTLDKTVDPGKVLTAATTVPSFPITYYITMENKGDLNALGVHITDTLPSEIQSITDYSANSGSLGVDLVSKVITWTGNISVRHTVSIVISAITEETHPVHVIPNTVYLWNQGSRGEVIKHKTATTTIAASIIYLPIVMKQ